MKQLQTKIQRTPTFILDKTTYHCGEEWEFGRNLIRFVSGVEWVLVRLEEGFPQIEFSNERPEAPRSPKITYPSKDQPTIEGVCVSNGGKIDFSGLFNASAEDKVLVKFKKDYQSLPFGIRSRGHDIDLFHSTRIITQLKEIREHLDEIDEYMRKERFWPIDRKKFNNQIRWAMEHLSEYLF